MKSEHAVLLVSLGLGAAVCAAVGASIGSPARADDKPAAAPLLSPGEILTRSRADEWRPLAPEETLYLELEEGRVVIELAPDFAPGHTDRIKSLARAGFYDGLEFYRVIEGFVAQAGDREGARDPGVSGRTIKAEFERRDQSEGLTFSALGAQDGYAPEVGWVKGFPAARDPAAGRVWPVHCPGAVAMARGNEPDSGGTEFYVVLGHAPRYLDRNLSVFGFVRDGQEVLQRLPRGVAGSGMIADGDEAGKILRMRVAADLPEAERSALEVLRSESASFTALVASRRNRPEEFFVYRPDHIDVCGVPVPVRPAAN